MQKKNLRLIFLLLVTILFVLTSSVVFANWPNMSTGPGGGDQANPNGGGSGYYLKSDTKTRYILKSINENEIIYEFDDDKGICGNTVKWVKDNKGIENPKVNVGEELFRELLKKAGKEPYQVMTYGKNEFTITAQIVFSYAKNGKKGSKEREWLSYEQAAAKNWMSGRYAKDLWGIACAELGTSNAQDTSYGVYYLPVVLHKELGTNKELARSAFNDLSEFPTFTIGTTTNGISSDYNKLIKDGYNYAGVSVGSSESDKTSPSTTETSITTDENHLFVTFWYSKEPIKTTLTVYYKDRNTKQEITPKETETITGRTDKYSKTIPGYKFVGSEKDNEGYKAEIAVQVIWNADGLSHTITFWYEKEPETPPPTSTTLTTRYRERGTNATIPGYSDTTETVTGPITKNYKTIPGYKFIGSEKDNEGYQEGVETQTIPATDGNSHTITFWYEKEPEQSNTQIYWTAVEKNTGDTLYPRTKMTVSVFPFVSSWKPDGMLGKGYEYANEVDVDGSKQTGSVPNISIQDDGKIHDIVYYYIRQKVQIMVRDVCTDASGKEVWRTKQDRKTRKFRITSK